MDKSLFQRNRIFDTDKYLYHYTSMDIAILYVLADNSLKFGSFTNTNDPGESNTWNFCWVTDDEYRDGPDSLRTFSEFPELFSEKLKNGVRILCFCQDTIKQGSSIEFAGRGFNKPRLWSQYGRNHSGVCLIFKKDNLITAIDKNRPHGSRLFMEPISYKDIDRSQDKAFWVKDDDLLKPGDYDKLALESIGKHYKNYYFTKDEDWASENEFRIALYDNSSEDIIVDYGDALAGIVLGINCDRSRLPLIKRLTKNKIPIYGVELLYNYEFICLAEGEHALA